MTTDIHQTLHGYSDGHRLLASSRDLSIKEQRTLQRLSDLSGAMTQGFNEYLTGYPIPDSQFYAFSKTWYAPEMARPGCVWTHTLLLDRRIFETVSNLVFLVHHFTRPVRGQYSSYKKPLPFEYEASRYFFDDLKSDVNHSTSFLHLTVFEHLYFNIRNVILLADNAFEYENLIFSLWNQQWPELRSRFTFCTGALNTREVNGQQFVLQIAPFQNKASLANGYQHESDASKQKGATRRSKLAVIDTKIEVNSNSKNIATVNEGLIKRFNVINRVESPLIWYFGSQLKPLRKNLGWLVKFFDLVKSTAARGDAENTDLSKVTKALAAKFPLPEEMSKLKLALYKGLLPIDSIELGLLQNTLQIKHLADEPLLLEELFKTEHWQMFEVKQLNIYNRTAKLLGSEPELIPKLIGIYNTTPEINPIRVEVLEAAAAYVGVNREKYSDEKNLEVILLLVDFNPWLAIVKQIWTANVERQKRIVDELLQPPHRKPDAGKLSDKWKPIVTAMLDAGNEIFVDKVAQEVGEDLVEIILDWHAAQNKNISKFWVDYLKSEENALLEWSVRQKNAINTKAFLLELLSPFSQAVINYGSVPWLNFAQEIDYSQFENSCVIAGFLFILGFIDPNNRSQDLVAASFEIIYEAVQTNSLPDQVWFNLEKIAPDKGFFASWDKCRRLEELLVKEVESGRWETQLLLRVASSPYTLWRLFDRLNSLSTNGRKSLKRLNNGFLEGRLKVSTAQASVFRQYFKNISFRQLH